MPQPDELQITEAQLIPGSPRDVWPLVTDPRHVKAWYAFGGAEIDLKPGGPMTLRWDEHGAFSAVVEQVTDEQLFSFRWGPAPGPLVEITLEPDGNSTRVRVVETGRLEDADQSALAWRNALRLLRDLAERRAGGMR